MDSRNRKPSSTLLDWALSFPGFYDLHGYQWLALHQSEIGLEIKAERLLVVRNERIGRHKMGLIEAESFEHQIECAMVFEGKVLVLVD